MRNKIHEIIEVGKHNSRISSIYDYSMIITIIASLIPMCFKNSYPILVAVEYIATTIFIIDYLLRLITADIQYQKGVASFFFYPLTPFAIIDLLSILPTFIPINSAFRLLRVLRLFRVMRVLKVLRYSRSFAIILRVLRRERTALMSVLCVAIGYIIVTALIMFSVEPDTFDSFFDALYWATTALTTVGYGDIFPTSAAGRIVSMVSSLAGIAVVALPAGIITGGYLSEIQKDK